MNRFIAAVLPVFLCTVHCLHAQKPVVMWQKCLGSNNGDYSNFIEPTPDGGFIIAGYTVGRDNGDVIGYHGNPVVGDIWIVKTDNAGNIQWQKCMGGSFFETGAYIHPTPDGGYIFAGTSASVDCNITGNRGGTDYWVVKMNSVGEVTWQKHYGGSKNEYAWSIALAPDGGYFVSGETESTDGDITLNHGNRDYWVIKIDGSGNLLWQKSLGGSLDDEAYSVQATADGGCITAGYTESNDGDVTGNHGKRDYWVVKLNNTGVIQWQKTLGGSEFDVAWSVQLTDDGGYIVAGYASSNNGDVSGNHQPMGAAFSDFWVVKLSSAGNLLWQKCYGGNKNEIAYFIQPSRDGGFLVCGSAESADGDLHCNGSITDMWVIKINSSGVLQWEKDIGGNYFDEAHGINELSDGTLIVVGNTCSHNVSGYHNEAGSTCGDIWLVKLSTPLSTVPAPVITINPASANVCAGVPATLTTAVLYGGINPVYQWTKNGVNVGTNSSTYTDAAFVNNDQIICSIMSGGACETTSQSASDAVTIKINSSTITPEIKISADNTAICSCTTVTFNATVTNGGLAPVYRWKVNGINTDNITSRFICKTLNPGDVVTCVYSDQTSCVLNGSVVSNEIQMKGGTGDQSSVTITASADTLCLGSAVTFTAYPVNAGTNPVYQWKINGVNAGSNNPVFIYSSPANNDIVNCEMAADPSYTCGGGGTANSNNIALTVTAKGIPSVSITTSRDSICTGAPVTFSAGSSFAGTNPSYQWKINGMDAGTNNKVFIATALADADEISCQVTVDPLFACALSNNANSNSIKINVRAQANPLVNISADVNDVCAGEMISITADAQNAGASPVYQWMVNNQPLQNSAPVFTSNTLSNGDAVYCIITPGSSACSVDPINSNTLTAIIEALPKISILPADTLIYIGQQAVLKATVDGNIASFRWSPADQLENQYSLTPSTLHLTDNITYTLTVKNEKGCEASSQSVIKVARLLRMPNAFSPNRDGLNDIFRIPAGVSLQLDEFSIFDRWGARVFSTHNISEGWNGTCNGNPVGAGTFVYYIKGSNEKGNVLLTGTVLLIR